MFNFNGKYVKIWKVEVKDNMVLCDLSTSKKDKDGKYVSSKYFKVKFVGKQLDEAKQLCEGDVIEITNGLIGKREYEKKYYDDLVVFGFEVTTKAASVAPVDAYGFQQIEDDDDIPF